MSDLKVRILTESNYKGLYIDGRTVRIALDPTKPITELKYPEFYDVKVTSHCGGQCPYCYQSSVPVAEHNLDIVDRFYDYFSKFTDNQLPFQIAFGGGEPTSHPDFACLMAACHGMGMVPNFTTNGMWGDASDDILSVTKSFCGGVAVSTHPHLESHWRPTVDKLLDAGVHTNLHVIVGDRDSINTLTKLYKEYTGRVKYFVLLPLSAQGRSLNKFTDWEYLSNSINGSPRDIAFGAMFHSYLEKTRRFNVSIYEPESMSAYLDLETMKVYKSSFSTEERKIG